MRLAFPSSPCYPSLVAGATTAVIGREAEQEAIRAFLAGTGMRALVIEGEAGIGKTTLWSAAVAEAAQGGYRVLACRPAGSEVQLSFAALGDLLDGVLEQALAELPTPQRRALEVALLLEEAAGPPPDQRAVGLALLGVLRLLVDSHPVLVAIDDAQWLDPSTAAVLEYAVRRLRAEPIALLAALRAEPGRPARTGLGAATPEERLAQIQLGPLSVAALHHLLRSRLDLALPRPLLLRVHETSGGNPFYAVELARGLEPPEELHPGDELPVSESLQELLGARVASLPEVRHDVLLAVASLSSPTVSLVEGATGIRGARSGLKAGAEAGVLQLRGKRVAFTHPLFAAAVNSQASPEERRRMHRRLAKVVDDPEAQARHLALGTAGRNASVAAALDRAADLALARGAPAAAAELTELAVEATPLRRRGDLRRRRLEAARAHFASGAFDDAMRILRATLDELPTGDERAEVLVRLAQASSRLDEVTELARRALGETEVDEIRARAHLLLSRTWPAHDLGFGRRHARLALEHAERAGERRLLIDALTVLSKLEFSAGRLSAEPLERAIELREHSGSGSDQPAPLLALGSRLTHQGRLDEARTLLEELISQAAGRRDEPVWLIAQWALIETELVGGKWEAATAHAESMWELAEQMGLEHDASWSLSRKALVDAHLGRVAASRSEAELGIALAEEAKTDDIRVIHLGVLGFLELSLGDEETAARYLQSMLDWVIAKGCALAPWPGTQYALEVLVTLGELDTARQLIDRFHREAHALESPWGLAVAARLRGLAASAEGDLTTALSELTVAFAFHDEHNWPFDHARTLLVLGRVQRRAKRKAAARHSLEQALSIFEELPAPLWTERTREEIRRLGLRPVDRRELTETERRVAELAAAGLRNREVAARLFMSPKTVEANLARAYRKLGIHSRAELGARLAGVGREPTQAEGNTRFLSGSGLVGSIPMRGKSYLVECYWPGVSEQAFTAAAARARSAALELREEGREVEALGSLLLPQDETVFWFFAGEEEDVRAASEQAGVPFERVLEALRIDGD